MRPLKVAVVSRHQLTRAGLTAMLAISPDRAQVYNVASHDGHLGGHDVAIYDLAGLVGSDGNDLAHLIASRVPVVALMPHGRPDLGEGALAAGAAQVVTVDINVADLLTVLEKAAAGEVATRATRSLAGEGQALPDATYQSMRAAFGLTVREVDILSLIASGVTNIEIAERLYLSINSVKTYVRQAYKKIEVTSRSKAVLWALEHRLGVVD